MPCPVPTGRPLPRHLTIPDLLTLETLAYVRMREPECRSKFTWRQLAGLPKRTVEGQQDVSEVSVALKIVLQLEGIRCQ
jgi:hypothetical protein